MKVFTSVCVLLLSITGCVTIQPDATRPNDTPQFNTLVLKNMTGNDIHGAEIRVADHTGVFTCNIILANAFCSNGFPARAYQGNAITIQWEDQHRRQQVGPLVVPPPALSTHQPLTAIIELHEHGQFNAFFRRNYR